MVVNPQKILASERPGLFKIPINGQWYPIHKASSDPSIIDVVELFVEPIGELSIDIQIGLNATKIIDTVIPSTVGLLNTKMFRGVISQEVTIDVKTESSAPLVSVYANVMRNPYGISHLSGSNSGLPIFLEDYIDKTIHEVDATKDQEVVLYASNISSTDEAQVTLKFNGDTLIDKKIGINSYQTKIFSGMLPAGTTIVGISDKPVIIGITGYVITW